MATGSILVGNKIVVDQYGIDTKYKDLLQQILDTKVEANPVGVLLVNYLFPVGTIYTSLDAKFDPNTAWTGTTWEKIKEGIFLEATETTAGTEKEAGLPNITGKFVVSGGSGGTALWTGCFTTEGTVGSSHSVSAAQTAQAGGPCVIDASRSSAVYGKSSTVQPHSITCFMWKRTN